MDVQPARDVALFAVSAALSIRASAVLVERLERLGERVGLSEAALGLLAALAADAPEITSSVTALLRGQKDVGVGVVLGSNVFNLAALLGLGAVVAGRISLHRRVVVFEGTIALGVAAVTLAALTTGVAPRAGLIAVLALFVPYVGVSAVGIRRLRRSPLPRSWRTWLARAIAEEEAELAGAIHPPRGDGRDLGVFGVALGVVVAASIAMEQSGSALGGRYGVPDIVIGGILLAAVTSLPNVVAALHLASHGRGAATLSTTLNSNALNVVAGLFIPAAVTGIGSGSSGATLSAAWFYGMTVCTLMLAFGGRGLDRRAGAILIAGYVAFVVVLVVH